MTNTFVATNTCLFVATKMILVAAPASDRSPHTRPTHSTPQEAYLLPACRTQYRQKSFFTRTVAEWNSLPPVAGTVEAFINMT